MKNTHTLVGVFLGLVLLLLFVTTIQRINVDDAKPTPVAQSKKVPCKGEPIFVDENYYGDTLEPHSCAEQCNNNKQRYLLYKNGRATQCETPPGCNDIGEDKGIECLPPSGNKAIEE